MIRQLAGAALLLTLCNGAWARSEFRIGGADNSWQSLLQDGRASYVLLNAEGGILTSEDIDAGAEVAGADTMIDYTGNAIRPVRIDPTENLSLTLASRKGHLNSSVSESYTREAAKELQVMIDGDPTTAVLKRVEFSPRLTGLNIGYVKNLVINLGAELPISRIRFFPRPGFEENYLQWYEIGVADDTAPFVSTPGERKPGLRWYRDIDRTLTATNDPAFDILESNTENLDVEVDLRFPTRDLHWVAIRPLNAERDWEIAEFEIYGEGYVTRTSYTSPIIDFGRPVAWSKVRWDGEMPDGTQVTIRTRTGNTSQPSLFWKVGSTGDFERVSEADYLTSFNAGLFSRVRIEYDHANWSTWSPPYDFQSGKRNPDLDAASWLDGTNLQSPSPTRYLQFQVLFRGNGDVAPSIENLAFLFAEEPAADEVFGEIWPLETDSFEPQTFTYVVRPILQAGNEGFDRLEIFTQSRALSVESVLVDGQEVLDRFPAEILDDRIILSFDQLQAPQDNEKRIEVVFNAKVLRFGTEFTGWVYNSDTPDLKQRIKPGNATYRFGGDVLSVRTPMSADQIGNIELSTSVFTPNGDGVNDQVDIVYDIRNIDSLTELVVKIYDLSGRVVRVVDTGDRSSGSFSLAWDGRDQDGAIVAPGIYMYQVELAADGGSKVASGTVAVAY